MSFLTLVLHSCTALSKSSETNRLFEGRFVVGTMEGLSEGIFVKERTFVALLNFDAEKRDHIWSMVS